MAASASIDAVLLDSGDVLMRPKGAGWWPRPALGEVLTARGWQLPPAGAVADALAAGMAYLDAHHRVADTAEELEQFTRYYEIVLDTMYGEPLPTIAKELAEATVLEPYNEPFPDTAGALSELATMGVRLGLLSNAWPSLEEDYRRWGLRDRFDVFVISSQVGMMKPQPSIYRLACDQLGASPRATLFVDDVSEYVAAAIDCGMHGVVMDRYGTHDGGSVKAVTDLAGVLAVVRDSIDGAV